MIKNQTDKISLSTVKHSTSNFQVKILFFGRVRIFFKFDVVDVVTTWCMRICNKSNWMVNKSIDVERNGFHRNFKINKSFDGVNGVCGTVGIPDCSLCGSNIFR